SVKSDLLLWLLIIKSALLVLGRSHHETICWDDNHLGAIPGAFAETRTRLQCPFAVTTEYVGAKVREHVGLHGPKPVELLLQVGLIVPTGHTKDDAREERTGRVDHDAAVPGAVARWSCVRPRHLLPPC